MRFYRDVLTADVNRKGVLDVDTVKGCSAGMIAWPDGGCYGACYAAATARFRGIEFSQAVVRRVHNSAHADSIVRAVRAAPCGFFRVGTMGDPCLAWAHTVNVVEWLAPYATPVVVTKHWRPATDDEFSRLVACGAVLNTSVSALDTGTELAFRLRQLQRYADAGGLSVARMVSCEFDTDTAEGARMAAVQNRLFALPHVIDNPLRIGRSHALAVGGVVRLQSVRDLSTNRTVSLSRPDTYLGHCGDCPEQCGLTFCGTGHPRPAPPQLSLFDKAV